MPMEYRSSNSTYTGETERFTARVVSYNYNLLEDASRITGKSINLLVNEAVDEYVKAHKSEWRDRIMSAYQHTIDKLAGD